MASHFNSSFVVCFKVLCVHCVGVVLGLQRVPIKEARDWLLEVLHWRSLQYFDSV